jgi:hypothetical protein
MATIYEGKSEAHFHGVSWAAVVAGAFVAAALSLTLLALGAGIGFSAVSPWTDTGASVTMIGFGAVVWLILMQLISSSMGGYLAGRLRSRWVSVHTDEVHFRDTAHGFLVWAVGLVVTAAFLTSAAASMLGGAAHAGAASSPEPNQSGARFNPNSYFVDELLRSNSSNAAPNDGPVRAEAGLIFANALRQGALPPADRTYLAQVVSAKTGMSQPDAEKRVDDTFSQDRQAADDARKAAAHLMYWTFLALLVGAFSASVAAVIGGKQRDRVVVI